MPVRRPRARPVPPKGRELMARAIAHRRVKPKGPGEASSVRSLVRRGLLGDDGGPTPNGQLWAEMRGVGR